MSDEWKARAEKAEAQLRHYTRGPEYRCRYDTGDACELAHTYSEEITRLREESAARQATVDAQGSELGRLTAEIERRDAVQRTMAPLYAIADRETHDLKEEVRRLKAASTSSTHIDLQEASVFRQIEIILRDALEPGWQPPEWATRPISEAPEFAEPLLSVTEQAGLVPPLLRLVAEYHQATSDVERLWACVLPVHDLAHPTPSAEACEYTARILGSCHQREHGAENLAKIDEVRDYLRSLHGGGKE